MDGTNEVSHARTQRPYNGNSGKKTERLMRHAGAFNRNAYALTGSRVTRQKPAAVEPEQKPIFSRKIVWLEKIKLHMKIIGCSVRLSLHLYLDQQGRTAIKQSKESAELDLNMLNNKENMQRNAKKVQEDFQDGQFVDAAQGTVKVVVGACKHVWYKIRKPKIVI